VHLLVYGICTVHGHGTHTGTNAEFLMLKQIWHKYAHCEGKQKAY